MAKYEVTAQFADGSQHIYKDVPASVTAEQIQARAQQDFPVQQLAHVDRKEYRSMLGQAGHDLGVMGRAAIQGAAAIPSLVVDAGNKLMGNDVAWGTNQAGVEGGLDALGFPRAENAGQRVASAVVEGGVGALAGMGPTAGVMKGVGALASKAGAKSLGPALSVVGDTMATSPIIQTVSGAAGGGAKQTALESGASDTTANLVGLGAGIGVGLNPTAIPENIKAYLTKKIQSQISPEVAASGRRMVQEGIPLTVGNLTNNKIINGLEAFSENVPFSGVGKFRTNQQDKLNSAVNRTMGETGENVSTSIQNAKQRIGGEYTQAYGTPFALDPQFQTELATIQARAARVLPESQLRPLDNMAEDIAQMTGANGVIDGQAAQNLKMQLDDLAKSSDTVLAQYAKQIRNSFTQAIARFDPTRGQQISTANRQYSNMKALEKATPNNIADGNVSAARLANIPRLTQGQDGLSNLAEGARQFVKPTVGNSGTAARTGLNTVAALATGGGSIPYQLAGTVASQAFNKGFNQNQDLINHLLNSSPTFQSLVNRGAPKATINYMLQQLSPEARERAREGEESDR